MQKNPYEILNLNSNASDSDVTSRYNMLKEKYQEERFLEGEKGNYAAKMLTEIEIAYQSIMNERKTGSSESFEGSANSSEVYKEVEDALRAGDINLAQNLLDNFDERTAEWHYLQSVVFYKKNWTNESKKQLELALRIEPANSKYKDAYEKLERQINFGNQAFSSGNAGAGQGTYNNERQMGGEGCTDAANCCSTMLCVNCLYNCCCGC